MPVAVPDESAVTAFAESPRLQLAVLAGQLSGRSEQVLLTQSRLRGLLRANLAIMRDLELPVLLSNIVVAAQHLVHASHAEFVPADTGSGPLERRPADQDGAQPANRPGSPVADRRSLGIPILIKNRSFGSLRLTAERGSEFSAEDEQLLVALAGAAAVAIANSLLYQELARQRRWLTASADLTRLLFADARERPLDAVVRYAVYGADADLATLALPVSERHARLHAVSGSAAAPGDLLVADESSLIGRIIRSGKPIMINDYQADCDTKAVVELPAGVDSVICVPLLAVDASVLAVLTVGRLIGQPAFTEADRDQLAAFAGHAGVALECERARAEQLSLRRIADRDRIAVGLNDRVIGELFSIGIGLQGMVSSLDSAEQRDRVMKHVDALDATIRRIRTTIFALQPAAQPAGGLPQRLLEVLGQEAEALGFVVGVEFRGPLGLAISAGLADDVVAVVREALSNVARHAGAGRARLRIHLIGALLSVEVTDDGGGIGVPTRSSGLANLRQRAHSHGGEMLLSTPDGGGTRLHWTARVPL
ncbi:MAG: GAF domain-containing protein [Jatrophihabitantaceae bacterium]